MVLLGVLNYLPTSLQFEGMSTAGSGLVTAAYGIGIVVFSRVVKVLSTSLPATRLIAVGGVLGTFAYVALVVDQALVGVLLGSILDRKSTRLNSSHVAISYAVFCLNKTQAPVT